MNYRADIDGLRALAIFSVLFFHLGYNSVSGGFVGVDVFFVISGFLITALMKREFEHTGHIDFKRFYFRRFRRLFPAFIVTMTLTAIAAAFIFSPTHLSRIGGAFASAVLSVSNIYFWLEADYFDITAKLKPFLHTWSLSVEEQFYLIWPALFLFAARARRFSAPLMLGVLGFTSLWLNVVFADGEVEPLRRLLPASAEWFEDGQATIFFLLPFRMFEFAIGALTVWAVERRTQHVSSVIYDVLFLTGLGLVGYAVVFFDERLLFPSFYALVPTVGAALLIYSGDRSRFRLLLTNTLAVGIGRISYSLYLVHWPLIVFWSYLSNGTLGIWDKHIILGMSLLFAYTSYRFVEQPFRTGRINIAAPRWRNTAIALALLSVTIGLHMKYSGGWNWRMPQTAVFEKAANAMDFHKRFYGGAGYVGKYPSGSKQADIVLMGDSHAQQYAYGLHHEWVEKEPGRHVLYVSDCFSCLYLPGIVNAAKPYYVKRSIAALQRDLRYIRRAHPKMVIISASWLHQMKQSDMIDKEGKRMHKSLAPNDVVAGILRLKKEIGESTLVVIGQVPGARYNLYDIFSRPHPLPFAVFDASRYYSVKARRRFTTFNRILKEAAQRTGAFVFLDPHDVLCDDKGMCRNLDEDGHLIYSDAYHLSIYGSRVVIRGFLPVLKTLMQERR